MGITHSGIIHYYARGLDHPASPHRGWTITSGTWNALGETWGLASETLEKIYDSCITQRQLGTLDIRVNKLRKVPSGAQEIITTALLVPNHNFGKDEYVVDIVGHAARYWQGTESGLLGDFEFKGASLRHRRRCLMRRWLYSYGSRFL